MNTFYYHRGSRPQALKTGIPYDTASSLSELITLEFGEGIVLMDPLPIKDINYTHLVTLNGAAVGYVNHSDKM